MYRFRHTDAPRVVMSGTDLPTLATPLGHKTQFGRPSISKLLSYRIALQVQIYWAVFVGWMNVRIAIYKAVFLKWSGRPDSNRRPPAPKVNAK